MRQPLQHEMFRAAQSSSLGIGLSLVEVCGPLPTRAPMCFINLVCSRVLLLFLLKICTTVPCMPWCIWASTLPMEFVLLGWPIVLAPWLLTHGHFAMALSFIASRSHPAITRLHNHVTACKYDRVRQTQTLVAHHFTQQTRDPKPCTRDGQPPRAQNRSHLASAELFQ